jgi:hypothetical protein
MGRNTPEHRLRRAVAGVVALGGLSTVSCEAASQAGRDTTVAELLGRDLRSPDGCSDTVPSQSLSSDLGPLLGTDGLRVVTSTNVVGAAMPEQYDSDLWGGAKLLIAVHESVEGPIVVRGSNGAGAELRFGMGATPVSHRVLEPVDRAPLDGGWRDFPNAIRVSEGGCYSLQFDYPAGTSTIALQINLGEST